MRSDRTREFDALLEYLKQNRGFDFTGYKRASLTRRIHKRMQEVGVKTYAEFARLLEQNPAEFDQLCTTVLINVTAFFRDGVPWDELASTIVPRILENKRPDEPLRVWSAGCASGEEAYTLAIILADALGADAFRSRVKIYATDVDEHALTMARHATYDSKQVEGVPPDLLEKYFERQDGRYIFRKDLRRIVIFGRNDLVQDAPISRVDLLVCRNTLMYFNAATQAQILGRFHFALTDGGYLFLGRAETLLAHSESFAPVDLKRRIFTKVPRTNYRNRLLAMAAKQDETEPEESALEGQLRDASWDTSPLAQIVVDANGRLVVANERARTLFNLGALDFGRPFQDLEISYRPTDLRSMIDQAHAGRKPLVVRNIEWPLRGGDIRWIDVQAAPLYASGQVAGVAISFDDVTAFQRLQRELEKSNAELEGAYEELQSTNEELETTNEELQSTVEELETTNEELQSTNEELETMNEELQSTNEELTTINDELRRRSDELNDVNAFMQAVLASLRGGVVVLDTELRVEVWNEKAVDLWGVRADEVRGMHFMMLDIGLPVQMLTKAIRACLLGESERETLTIEAINRRGKPITCEVTCTPMWRASGDEVRGVILVMEEGGARDIAKLGEAS
ncbi:MAG TPA: CheR family methyltransferase [Gemmatimonadaceae bacterium]